jgi:predicted enzyme related to lactoylglutathione lyase
MPKVDAIPTGAPCWIELFTSDTDRGRAFYEELFGWTSVEGGPEYGGYSNFFKDGAMIAGCMKNDGQSGTPDVWSIYLTTDDAERTVKEAAAAGGQVIVPAMQVMDLGTMSVVTDPGGAAIGGWQPGQHRGFGLLEEQGAPSWFELHTRDYDAAVAFYRDVFKWDVHTTGDTPDFRYSTLGDYASGSARAGIMDATAFLPDGVPAHWSVYFHVDDIDGAVATVEKLGGSVIMPVEDTPYGRLAHVADALGTQFKLRTPPAAGS